ncbi:Zinc finger, RING-type [Dillenia turbinata]|uniref:RING-type E3 ubiquitin transferase n=1 Tax=Dillenia turbinata TaxID=194707 RepID=A0AAN8VUP8_9MAGN
MNPRNRKLLSENDTRATPLTQAFLESFSPVSPLELHNSNSSSSSLPIRKPLKPNSSFDSSMALTILVLLTALFFMGFFSVYIRRFADENSVDLSRRRRNGHHSTAQSSAAQQTGMLCTRQGLDPAAVRSLPMFSYDADAKHPIDCAVCLTEFEDGETVKVIPCCRHVFHPCCIDTWLSSHVSCPLCRSTQLFRVEFKEPSAVRPNTNTNDQGRSTSTSTVEIEDTSFSVEREGMRRSSSSPSFGEHLSLQRSSSF